MPVELADVGRRGRMELTFTLQDGRTVLRHSYCEVPFKITHLFNSRHQPQAHLILMHSTAGVFGGDNLECTIRIERGARVLLTQQSATKVHPSKNWPALQKNHIVVEADAELQLYLEPIIPFADSWLSQTTHFDIEPTARLVFWEAFMAGRIGHGERWQFRQLASEMQLRSTGNLLYLERFCLPPNGSPALARFMHCRSYIGAGVFVGTRARDFATRLHEALPEAGIDVPTGGVSVVRVVSNDGPEFHHCRQLFAQEAIRST